MTISNGVISLGEAAFGYCASLANVTIPGSVTNIGDSVFYGCISLTSVYFNCNAPTVGTYAFYSDNNATIYYFPGATGWSSPFAGLLAEQFAYEYTTNSGAITITGYTGLGGAVNIPEVINDLPVTSIESNVFYENTALTNIAIPGSVTNIGADAFYGCSGLTSVAIPASVASVGAAAFSDCSGLTSVTIPGSLISFSTFSKVAPI